MPADRKWSAEVRQRVVERYVKGDRVAAICKDEGMPQSSFYNILKTDVEVAPQRLTRRKTGAPDQVDTLAWMMNQMFAMDKEVARLRAMLLEWSINPETGEEIPDDT